MSWIFIFEALRREGMEETGCTSKAKISDNLPSGKFCKFCKICETIRRFFSHLAAKLQYAVQVMQFSFDNRAGER
jgi:hypothetical protein